MATIKSFSDLQQSKKLAEILPFESADMYYNPRPSNEIPYVGNANTALIQVPCWSLAALFSILPNNEHITTSLSRGSWQLETITYLPNTWWCEYEDSKSLTEFNVSADNPVDACVAMIEKLHKHKIL